MMGSMGRAAGDAIIAAIEHAVAENRPFVMVTSSGGARMQENILSLMQMARTTVAVNKLHANGIPYIVLLTDPTFGGVTASFAMLGDIHIAEKGRRCVPFLCAEMGFVISDAEMYNSDAKMYFSDKKH